MSKHNNTCLIFARIVLLADAECSDDVGINKEPLPHPICANNHQGTDGLAKTSSLFMALVSACVRCCAQASHKHFTKKYVRFQSWTFVRCYILDARAPNRTSSTRGHGFYTCSEFDRQDAFWSQQVNASISGAKQTGCLKSSEALRSSRVLLQTFSKKKGDFLYLSSLPRKICWTKNAIDPTFWGSMNLNLNCPVEYKLQFSEEKNFLMFDSGMTSFSDFWKHYLVQRTIKSTSKVECVLVSHVSGGTHCRVNAFPAGHQTCLRQSNKWRGFHAENQRFPFSFDMLQSCRNHTKAQKQVGGKRSSVCG